jgi:hypothetical protein
VPDVPTWTNFEQDSLSPGQPTFDRPYLAHLGKDGKHQRLLDHLLQVSRLTARQGAKIGMMLCSTMISGVA